jgi:DnaJ family protein C protein 15
VSGVFDFHFVVYLHFCSPSARPERIKTAYKKIMILNHPDRGNDTFVMFQFSFNSLSGGSPYLAGKINEAKDLMDRPGGSGTF